MQLRTYFSATGLSLAALLATAGPLAGQGTRYQPPVQQRGVQPSRVNSLHLRQPPAYFQVQGSAFNGRGGGASFEVTVTAMNGWGQPLTSFTGPITLSSSDPSLSVQNLQKVNGSYVYPFTACAGSCDNGRHTFILSTNDAHPVISITGPDGMQGRSGPLGATVNDSLQAAAMEPGNAVLQGSGTAVVVVARTPDGRQDQGYTGTIEVTAATDPHAAMQGGTPLPASYTFTSDVGQPGVGGYQDMNPNDGRAALTIIPGSTGQQTYTFTDQNSGQSASLSLNVNPPAAAPAAAPQIWRMIQDHQPAAAQSLGLNDFGETAMAFDEASGRMVLLGEANADGLIWLSTNDGGHWTQACGGPARVGTSLAYDEATRQIALFGGNDANSGGAQAGLWVSDARDCLSPAAAGNGPAARAWASMAYDPTTRLLVLWGGTGSRGGVWSWDGRSWTRHAAGGPPARQAAMLAWDGHSGKMLLFGGWDGSATDSNESWELDTAHWTWTRLTPAHLPPARHGAEMQWDAAYQGDILFGGDAGPLFNNQGRLVEQQFNDSWLWNGSDWQELQGSYISANANGQPSGRDGAGMAYDSRSGAMVLEGGSELLSQPPSQSGLAAQGQNCGGCKVNPGSASEQALEQVETRLDDTWSLPAPSGQRQAGIGNVYHPPLNLRPLGPASRLSSTPARPAAARAPQVSPPRLWAPLAQTQARLAASPLRYQGACPAQIRLTATLVASRAGTLFYRLQYGGRPLGPVYRLQFDAAGQRTFTTVWTLPRAGAYWARIAITSPIVAYSNVVTVQSACH